MGTSFENVSKWEHKHYLFIVAVLGQGSQYTELYQWLVMLKYGLFVPSVFGLHVL